MMFNARHRVVPLSSPEELADALVEIVDGETHARSLCLCSGFYYDGYLWLNDSRVPDALHFYQEWGVIKSQQMFVEGTARQVDSITLSMDRDELIELIERVTAGDHDGDGWDTHVRTEPPEIHTCDQCR